MNNQITVTELTHWRSTGMAHTLIDVRRAVKRAQDGDEIAGSQWRDPALWLDWKDSVAQDAVALGSTQQQHPVVLCCAQGHEISQGLSAALRAMGVDARYLVGGMQGWREAGSVGLVGQA